MYNLLLTIYFFKKIFNLIILILLNINNELYNIYLLKPLVTFLI